MVTARLAVTVLRDKVVVENGALSGELRDGRFLKRKIANEIRSRPAV